MTRRRSRHSEIPARRELNKRRPCGSIGRLLKNAEMRSFQGAGNACEPGIQEPKAKEVNRLA